MGVVWLVVALLCIVAGLALLRWDRRRARQPDPSQAEDPRPGPAAPGDLFTPEALPRQPEDE